MFFVLNKTINSDATSILRRVPDVSCQVRVFLSCLRTRAFEAKFDASILNPKFLRWLTSALDEASCQIRALVAGKFERRFSQQRSLAFFAQSRMEIFLSLARSRCAEFNALLLNSTVFLILTSASLTYVKIFSSSRIVVSPTLTLDSTVHSTVSF